MQRRRSPCPAHVPRPPSHGGVCTRRAHLPSLAEGNSRQPRERPRTRLRVAAGAADMSVGPRGNPFTHSSLDPVCLRRFSVRVPALPWAQGPRTDTATALEEALVPEHGHCTGDYILGFIVHTGELSPSPRGAQFPLSRLDLNAQDISEALCSCRSGHDRILAYPSPGHVPNRWDATSLSGRSASPPRPVHPPLAQPQPEGSQCAQ